MSEAIADSEVRLVATAHAMSAARYLEPVAPDFRIAWQAISALCAYGTGDGDLEYALAFRKQLSPLRDRLTAMAEEFGLARGMIVAGMAALDALLACLTDDPPDIALVARYREEAADAARGVGFMLHGDL